MKIVLYMGNFKASHDHVMNPDRLVHADESEGRSKGPGKSRQVRIVNASAQVFSFCISRYQVLQYRIYSDGD